MSGNPLPGSEASSQPRNQKRHRLVARAVDHTWRQLSASVCFSLIVVIDDDGERRRPSNKNRVTRPAAGSSRDRRRGGYGFWGRIAIEEHQTPWKRTGSAEVSHHAACVEWRDDARNVKERTERCSARTNPQAATDQIVKVKTDLNKPRISRYAIKVEKDRDERVDDENQPRRK